MLSAVKFTDWPTNILLQKNKKKAVRDYITQDKLKCYTCHKIGHLIKNCNLKDKLCPKCNNKIVPYLSKALWKCSICHGNHSAANSGCPSVKAAISKSLDCCQNLSYAQAVCRRTAKKEIQAFKANVLINIHHLTKDLWKINKDESNTIDQLGSKIAQIIKQTVKSSSG